MLNSKCKLRRTAVLYEDDDCIVLDKPAGLAVQGGAGVTASVDALLAASYPWKPHLVHRLDKETSGVLLVAKSAAAAAAYSSAFAGRRALKQYLALCAAPPENVLPQRGILEEALDVHGTRKEACTRYIVRTDGVLGGERWTLFELEPATGRMHQIRRHLAGAGYPVIGDGVYGDFALNKRLRKIFGHKRMFLHAFRLALPCGGASLDISAPLPAYWQPFEAPFMALQKTL